MGNFMEGFISINTKLNTLHIYTREIMSKIFHKAAETKKRLRELNEEKIKESKEVKSNFLKPSIVKNPSENENNELKPKKTKLIKKSKALVNNNDDKVKNVLNEDKEVQENIIYVGHLPIGFHEGQMRQFFTQFGEVKRIKLFRSEKTKRSKCYAFIEFTEADVAKVVSETMNGYLMHEKQLVSNVVPKEKIHDGMFKKPKQQQNHISL